jgi:hypothetical protein
VPLVLKLVIAERDEVREVEPLNVTSPLVVNAPVVASVPSTDKLEASVVVLPFTRICHP